MSRRQILYALIVAFVCAGGGGAAAAVSDLATFERAVAADPENLGVAATYRQAAIEANAFDRAIDFLEQIAKRKNGGPNGYISYALALVDKVPTAGEIRRLYLGRDAMNALTKSIERRPSALAYYVRGLINIYYNNFIFHRIPRGIADFEKALTLLTPETPPVLGWRVYMSMGDGHWRQEERDKAREVWKRGLAQFPGAAELLRRVSEADAVVERIVHDAVDPDTRVDTTLRGVVP